MMLSRLMKPYVTTKTIENRPSTPPPMMIPSPVCGRKGHRGASRAQPIPRSEGPGPSPLPYARRAGRPRGLGGRRGSFVAHRAVRRLRAAVDEGCVALARGRGPRRREELVYRERRAPHGLRAGAGLGGSEGDGAAPVGERALRGARATRRPAPSQSGGGEGSAPEGSGSDR